MNPIENREDVEDYVFVIRVHGEETVGYLSVQFESAGKQYCYFTWSNKVAMVSNEGETTKYGVYYVLVPERILLGAEELEIAFNLEPLPVNREEAKAQVVEQRELLGPGAIFQVSMTQTTWWPGMLADRWLSFTVPPDENEFVEYLFSVEGIDQDFIVHRQTSNENEGPEAERQELLSIFCSSDQSVFWRIDPVEMKELVCWITAEEIATPKQTDEADTE